MSNTLIHKDRFPGVVDTATPDQIGPNVWLREHVFQGGVNGQVLVWDGAQTDKVSWTSTPTFDNLILNKVGPGAATNRGLQILRSHPSSEYTGLEKALWIPGADGVENYGLTITTEGLLLTGSAIVVSGFINANGQPEEASVVSGTVPYEPAMVSITPDIVGPALQVAPQQPGSYVLSALDLSGHHVFNIEANGSLTWGAGARGAEDVTLARSAAGALLLSGGTTPALLIGNSSSDAAKLTYSANALVIRTASGSGSQQLTVLGSIYLGSGGNAMVFGTADANTRISGDTGGGSFLDVFTDGLLRFIINGQLRLSIDGSGNISIPSLPTSDPHVAGRVWRSGMAMQVSVG